METNDTRTPPRGPRGLRDPREWHRDYPGRRIAGVCQSLAENLEISVSAVRIAFVLLALFRGLGVVIYLVLWALLPPRPGAPSPLDRALRGLRSLLAEGRPAGHDRQPRDPRPEA